jgi:hypothetical protein
MLLCAVLVSCGSPVRYEHLVGPWRLVAPDVVEDTCILWEQGEGGPCIIQPTVYAAGYDDKYIVAENHPGEVKSRTSYWYIIRDPQSEDDRYGFNRAKVMGPFTEKQFGEQKARLHLPDFSVAYDDLQ